MASAAVDLLYADLWLQCPCVHIRVLVSSNAPLCLIGMPKFQLRQARLRPKMTLRHTLHLCARADGPGHAVIIMADGTVKTYTAGTHKLAL